MCTSLSWITTAQVTVHGRTPASQIHARLLSGVRKLMGFMSGKPTEISNTEAGGIRWFVTRFKSAEALV